MARKYRKFVKEVLNQELPRALAVQFIHWDMKAKKKDPTKRYEVDMLEHA